LCFVRNVFFLCIGAFILTWGCSEAPRIDPSQTRTIFADAHTLLEKYPSPAAVEATFWPESVRALRPEAVRTGEEGLYIVTWSRGVEETGVFVPRDPRGFSPQQGADPEYTVVANDVFVYRVRG
jgi:hypothetical protein